MKNDLKLIKTARNKISGLVAVSFKFSLEGFEIYNVISAVMAGNDTS